jgi:hypothetical protein
MKYCNRILIFSAILHFFVGVMLAENLLSTSGSLMRHAKIHATNKPSPGCVDANFFDFFAGAMFAENLLSTSAP